MRRILLLGATGKLGKVVVQQLLQRHYHVVALVRNPEKLTVKDAGLTFIRGDVTKQEDLAKTLKNVDAVISTLGHGFRTSYPVQEKTLTILLPLMEKSHIKRFITVTGAALPVGGDQNSLIATITEQLLKLIDPPRMSDARRQQELLEKSTLDWTVVRTPVHNNKNDQLITHIGLEQPYPWRTLSRVAIAKFIIQCIEEKTWIQQSPIIY